MAARSVGMQVRGLGLLVVLTLLACKKSPSGAAPADAAPSSAPAATTATAESERYITDRDLERVCSGEPVKEAKAYDGARGRVHPTVAFMAKFKGGYFERYEDKGLDAWKASENKGYELVLCVTPTRTTKVKTCELETTGGEKRHLELEDASYDIVLYEAKTAKQVAKKSVDLKVDRQCPAAHLSPAFLGTEAPGSHACPDGLGQAVLRSPMIAQSHGATISAPISRGPQPARGGVSCTSRPRRLAPMRTGSRTRRSAEDRSPC